MVTDAYFARVPVAWLITTRWRNEAEDHRPFATSSSVKVAMRICFCPVRLKS